VKKDEAWRRGWWRRARERRRRATRARWGRKQWGRKRIEERERAVRRKIYRGERMTAGPHQLVVGIEDEYRVWMGAGEMSLEERIFLTRTEYSF
jgi:hypothetical protein